MLSRSHQFLVRAVNWSATAQPYRRLATGAMWSLASGIVLQGGNVLLAVVSARLLDTARFGQLGILQSTIAMFGVLGSFGLGLTSTKYVAEYRSTSPSRAGSAIGTSVLLTMLMSLPVAGIVICAAPALARTAFKASELTEPLRLCSFLILLNALNGTQTGALVGLEAFKAVTKINALRAVVAIPLTVPLVARHGVSGAVWGLLLSAAIACVTAQIAMRRQCRRHGVTISYASGLRQARSIVSFSLPVLLSGTLIAPVNWLICAILVQQPGGYGELGLFTAAEKFRMAVLFIPAAFSNAVLPMLIHSRGISDRRTYSTFLRANTILAMLLTALPALAIVLFREPIMLLYGSKFGAGSTVLAIAAFTAVPVALNTVLGQAVVSCDYIWPRFGFDAMIAGTLLLGGLYLVPHYRAVGVASAYGIAYTVVLPALAIFLRRSGMRYKEWR